MPLRSTTDSGALRAGRPAAIAALCGAAGVAHALAFAPWHRPWLQWLALAVAFAVALRAARPREAALAGFAFGVGWFGFGVSWVYVSMHVYGEMAVPLAALATAAFCAFLALYPALAFWFVARLAARPAVRGLLALPAAWAAAEWLRGVALTGFPWLSGGYAHSDGPLAGYAPVLGLHGVNLAAGLIAGALACLFAPGPASPVRRAATLLLPLVVLAVGQALRGVEWTRPEGPPLRVLLAQGNVPQNLKFADGGMRLSEDAYLPLLRQAADADLVVLPESVFPLPLARLPEATLEALAEVPRRGAALIFGIFIEEPPGHYFNSAVGLAPDGGAPQRYSKRHLVPFGEFIPLGFRWFVDLMNMPIGDQQRGAAYQRPMHLAGQRIAVNICYEDLFGAEIRAAWRDPAQAPTLLLNLSNLGWFDDSLALPQHLQISRLRALETGRPVLRATNTGATAIIDGRGDVVAQLPFLSRGALAGEIRGYVGDTPYLRFGDVPAFSTVLAMLALALVRRRAS